MELPHAVYRRHGRKRREGAFGKGRGKALLAEVNVLKVAHHGSKYSSGEAFLDAIKPRWAVVSYGVDNSYGHPHQEVLDRLKERGTEVFKTGEGGAIRMWTDGERIRFESFVDGEKFSRYN